MGDLAPSLPFDFDAMMAPETLPRAKPVSSGGALETAVPFLLATNPYRGTPNGSWYNRDVPDIDPPRPLGPEAQFKGFLKRLIDVPKAVVDKIEAERPKRKRRKKHAA